MVLFAAETHAQSRHKNYFTEITTWTLLQTVPSSFFIQDRNESDTRLQYALQWNVTPVNFSFNANKLISPVQFFIVNPVRRYGGSAEIFVQPVWATSSFKNSDLTRFSLSAGARIFIPAVESGEYLSFSVGAKYRLRKNNSGGSENTYAAEISSYTFFGILGFQFNYNFTGSSKYDFGICLKYY